MTKVLSYHNHITISRHFQQHEHIGRALDSKHCHNAVIFITGLILSLWHTVAPTKDLKLTLSHFLRTKHELFHNENYKWLLQDLAVDCDSVRPPHSQTVFGRCPVQNAHQSETLPHSRPAHSHTQILPTRLHVAAYVQPVRKRKTYTVKMTVLVLE